MPTQASLDTVQNIYIAFYGRPADPAGLNFWADQLDLADGDVSAIIDVFADSAEYQDRFGGLDNEELVNNLYQQAFGRDAEPAGLTYWVEQLEAGNITLGAVALEILNGAQNDDLATIQNKKVVADAFTAQISAQNKQYDTAQIAAAKSVMDAVTASTDPAAVNVAGTISGFPAAQEPTDPTLPGETFMLTEGRDVLTGTDGDDTFIGLVGQNQNGAVANAFSTGDMIDGGAGRDTIKVSLTNDYSLGSTSSDDVYGNVFNGSAPRPITVNVEEVYIEALATSGTVNSSGQPTSHDVVLDATRMEGVEEFWSDFSRDDLTIAGINLRGSNLNITKDVTFGIKDTMHGTDFTALFDSLSLTREAASQSNSQLLVRIADVSTETPEAPLTNVNLNLSFDLGEDTITLENVQSTDGSYAGLVTAIKNALALEGYANLTVELSTPYSQVTFAGNTVNLPFIAQEILVTDPAGNEFDNVSFTQSAIQPVVGGFLVAGNASAVPPGASSNLIESNLVLDNAGNGSTAGNVLIGGMSNSNLGVERFNVLVDRDSKIASLNTNNNALQEIHISSLEAEGDLWIGATQADLNEIDANAFAGQNLSLGEGTAISDLTFLDASGTSANVTFVADYNGTGRASDKQAFVANTGSGNDSITASLVGTSTSTSTQASLSISSTGGNNTVTLSSDTTEINVATVTLGSGNDIVTGGATHLRAETGAGNDVIFAENTGTKAVHNIDPDLGNEALLLHGRTVTVTLTGFDTSLTTGNAVATTNGFESAAIEITGSAGNNYLTSQADYNNAIVKAINEDPVLSTLAKASINSLGTIDIEYTFDGVISAGAINVDIGGNDVWADISSASIQNTIESAYRAELSDSTIDVVAAYNAVDALSKQASTIVTAGVDSTDQSDNIINAGAGNDVIVLSTDVTGGTAATVSNDTIVFTGHNQGKVTIVNFTQDTAVNGGDLLDFTAYLTNQESLSGSPESRTDVNVTVAADESSFIENSVVVTDFTTLGAGGALGTATFANMTEAQVEAAMNANFSEAAVAATNLVGTERKAVMMVENVNNAGEYKIYEVTFDNVETNAEDFSVQLIGVADFGNSLGIITAADTLIGA